MPVLDTHSVSPLLDILFEDGEVGRCLLAPDGSVLRASREWLRSTGLRLDAVLGANFIDLFPETRDLTPAIHARARAGNPVTVPVHAQHLEGRETWWEGRVEPVPMEGGTGLLITVREVSRELHRALEGERAARVALENALGSLPDGFVFLDRDWRVTYVNQRAASNVGFDPGGLKGRNLWDTFPQLLGTAVEAAYRRVMSERTPLVLELEGTLSDRWYRQSISPATDGISIVWTDITDRRQGELKLAERESDLRAIFNAVDESIWLFSVEGVAIAANRTALDRWGGPPETILGKRLIDFLPEGLAHQRLARLQETAATGRLVQFEDIRAGIRFEHRFYPVADASGRVDRIAVFSRDVTEQRRTEEALRESETRSRKRAFELETVLDAVPAAVWIARDQRGDQIQSNRFGAELLRRPHGANDSVTAPGEDRPRNFTVEREGRPLGPEALPIQRAARTGEDLRDTEFDLVFDDGDVRHMLGNVVPLRDAQGLPTGSVGAFIDVTRHKTAEQEVREADRRKTEFLAVLSHELRNPLAPIRSSIHVLDKAQPGSEQAARAREVIRRQVDHLVRLVDDLLDVMRLSRGKIQIQRQRIDLRDVVRRATDDLLALFEQNRLQLRVEHAPGPVWVDADATRMAQVLGNLLQNALKFTPPPGTVTVTLIAAGRSVELHVRDTGIGMAPRLLERMFEPFIQEDQGLARTRGGLGLGLYLVRSLVELHCGSVAARSDGLGAGSELVVTLPLAGLEAGSARAGKAYDLGPARSILLIEDNADAASSLADVLALDGHLVRVAPDARSGLTLAREKLPGVILCDVGLPDMDGYEVARMVRSDPVLSQVRLVALTGYAQPEDRRRALEAGFDAHLAKPPPPEELARVLRALDP